MEGVLSHSRPRTFSANKKPPPPPPSSSSSFHNHGGFFNTSYDDVFGGPPLFASSSSSLAPRAEDYSEIFGGVRSSSRASSIPVLDLPVVPDHVHSAASNFAFSEVFRRFDAVDLAVPSFDELFRPSELCYAYDDGSSDDAWTPVGTESLSDGSDPFASSEKSQCFSNENSHQPLESKQFNVSYHKVNLGTSTYMENTTHVAQLNDVPGYTCVVDEAMSLREMGKERLCSAIADDIILNMDPLSVLSEKHTRKTKSHTSYGGAGLESFDGDLTSERAFTAHMSHVNSTFKSVSDINLGTEPSHLPPPSRLLRASAERNEDFNRLNSGPKASQNCGLDATFDDSLPRFFDMEADAISSAAASAASMKDAVDKAQAKLKAAKEMRNRKEGVHNSGQLGLRTHVNGGENVKVALDECASGETRVHATSDTGLAKMKNPAKARRATNTSQNFPDISATEWPTGVTGKPTKKEHGMSSLSSDTTFTEAAGEWKEAEKFYEFVNNDKTRLGPQPQSNGDGKAASEQEDNDDCNSDFSGEACAPGENRRRLKAAKAVSRQEYYEKMVKVVQEVHDHVINGHTEPDKRLKGMSQGNQSRQDRKFVYEPEKNLRNHYEAQVEMDKPDEVIWKEAADLGSKNVLEKEGSKKKETEVCHREWTERNTKSPHESMDKEAPDINGGGGRMRGSCEREESERRVQDNVVRGGHEKRAEESCIGQKPESKLAEGPKQKRNKEIRDVMDKRSKEAFEHVFGGERLQTACRSQENDRTRYLQSRKEEDMRLKEVFEQRVLGREGLQRAFENQENGSARDWPQRDEYENIFEEASDGQGYDKMKEEFVELEKFRINKEALEQEKRKRPDAALNHIINDEFSEEDQKQNENLEKAEKTTDKEHVGHNSKRAGELEESEKIHGNTSDEEDKMDVYTELLVEDKHLNSCHEVNLYKEVELDSLPCKIKMPQISSDDSQEVSAQKENDVPPNKEGRLKAVETTDVLIEEIQIESTASQEDPNESELKRTAHVSDTLHMNENKTKLGEVCTGNEQILKEENKKVAELVSDPKMANDCNHEQGGKRRNLAECQAHFNHEEKVRSTRAKGIHGWSEHVVFTKEVADTVKLERKQSFQKRSQLPNLGQSVERKGNIINHNCSSSEEKDEEKERDFEKERLKKLEEEREREIEREKDRMAVEIAIHEACEARERAYVDARDRAERAALERETDEARQRALAEARERLEKACSGARERSLADKASDGRLRAERAAVERATMESRQRAIERAMAERATLIQRSVSEKYSCARDVVMRQSSFPSSSGRFEAADVEPAQRCKARLERHHRTVERVAKALAEKNMRDLLAQREQAERNRLAEALDSDIRRWSSGKEGNLRALLSTLQYILGPDSGWQPIPLTEVITAAAVKKAYRKATLCVHPDKLQQRCASIQQKYICEKVFDLLKEAWSRFNSEEE